MKAVTVRTLRDMKREKQRFSCVTAYDASFARLAEAAGIETILVGDSLGMVLQGHDSTLPVTLTDVIYHTACVARGSKRAWIIADMPFGTFQAGPADAFRNAAQLMAAGAQMVKVEGGETMVETIRFLTARGIPVCGHLGLTPQSVNTLGGYRIQGKTDSQAKQLIAEAKMLEEAGAGMLVLELIPAALSRQVTAALRIPTIGIGAGVDCSGQVLVLHDMLDVYPGKKARFVKNFLTGAGSVQGAVEAYVREVKAKTFPAAEHSY